MPGSYASARIARGPNRAPGRLVVEMSNGAPDDGDVGLPLVELLGVGQERPLGERGEPAEHAADRQLLLHRRRSSSRRGSP